MITLATTLDSGDTTWVLMCAALVLFMTPGLAFFYAGMVRTSNTLVMLQQNFVPLGVISLTWVLFGYTLAFGKDVGSGVLGDLKTVALTNLEDAPPSARHVVSAGIAIPSLAFVAYQMMFAIITPALATGAVADRMKFAGWVVFLAIWSVIVYAPIAHWLWAPAGWLTKHGAQDWAGGMVVHASAGAAALALLVVLGRRRAWPDHEPLPHSIPLVLLGGGILWFGWFGFNAGDGLKADGVAAQALVNTHIAGAAAMAVWLLLEHLKEGHPTVLGAITGAVAGLATITPCAGYVDTMSALVIGLVAAAVCYLALRAKVIFRYDDALDVIAVHFVGGVLGSLLLGLFGRKSVNSIGADGLFHGGGLTLLGWQVVALASVVSFSFGLTWVIAMAIEKTVGLRVSPEDEGALDARQQGMDAYHFSQVLGFGHEAVAADAVPEVQEPAEGSCASGATPASVEEETLVTALIELEGTEIAALRQALLAVGARTIIISEAHVLTDEPKQVSVRDGIRSSNVVERLRVEVLVPRNRVNATRAAFDELTALGSGSGFVLDLGPRL